MVRLDEAALPPRPLLTRFAPSPTGYLHLGHVAHALFVWGIARRLGAQVLLRIEDHDRGRCRPEYEAALLEDLDWLGFAGDGPTTRQSERGEIYLAHAAQLAQAGLAYGCTCSRKEILARTGESDGAGELRYDNHCRDQGHPRDEHTGWRVCLPDEAVAFEDLRLGPITQHPQSQCGDLLLRDRHANWTYQFAVVVDDALQGVNLVIRGEDLIASTGRQIMLARLLGRDSPPAFLHHPLIFDQGSGFKLSKRDRAHAVRECRIAGESAESVLARAAEAVGSTAEDLLDGGSALSSASPA